MDWSAQFPNPAYSLSTVSQTKCQTTVTKILCKYIHVYISIVMLSESRKDCKTVQRCSSENYTKLISSQFLDSAIFIPQCQSKTLQVPQPSKISNNALARWSSFYGMISHCASRIHKKSKIVACQCTTSV
jgi:hypothetical protein